MTNIPAALRYIPTIYCDTDTVWNNAINKPDGEWIALEKLLELHKLGKVKMMRSAVVARELSNTKDVTKREKLLKDYDALEPIPLDEKVLGIFTQTDRRGGTNIVLPMVSDVQDESTFGKLRTHNVDHRDAQHIAQAIANKCDVFMTRDKSTIIEQHGKRIEEQFSIEVRTPSEMVKELADEPPETEL